MPVFTCAYIVEVNKDRTDEEIKQTRLFIQRVLWQRSQPPSTCLWHKAQRQGGEQEIFRVEREVSRYGLFRGFCMGKVESGQPEVGFSVIGWEVYL